MDEIARITAEYTYGTWRRQRGWTPLTVVDAQGCFFTDAGGRHYLDLSSQLMCSNLGHKNQAVIDAISEQARTLAFASPGFATEARARLTTLLLEVLPRGLDKFFFTTSGTEAVEAAIKIARMCTGMHKIVSRYRSYHGSTAGAIACTGDLRRWWVEPSGKIDGVVFGPDCYCYRCPLGKTYPECAVACADYIDYMLEHEGNVAAVIVEPVVGTNGVLVPPPEYLPRLRQICDRHRVLLIADEVMAGWGRTGRWFAVDHSGVVPDILCTAKGITGAYVPLGLTATSRRIADYFGDNFFAHGHTYEAHPLTLGPAIAAIGEYRRLGLIERARDVGEYLGDRLRSLARTHPSIGEVRGLGLFWAVELVSDRQARTACNTQRDKFEGKPLVVDQVTADLMKRGVYCVGWVSHLVIAPPLIITREEIDQAVDALDSSLALADARVTA